MKSKRAARKISSGFFVFPEIASVFRSPGFTRLSHSEEGDFGLLFQDAPSTQKRIDALGPEYARDVTVEPRASFEIMRTK